MTLGRQHFFHNALGILNFYWIENRFLGHADAPLAKGLQHVRLGHAFQSFELNVANDWQLFNFKDDANAAARCVLDRYARANSIKESKGKQCLQIAFDLRLVVRIAGPRLNVIKDVVFPQTAIADDVDFFDQALRGLLGAHGRGD